MLGGGGGGGGGELASKSENEYELLRKLYKEREKSHNSKVRINHLQSQSSTQ
jgi:hypothetical protein